MAGNGDRAGTAADGGAWLGPLFEKLRDKVLQAADTICAEEVEGLAGAEKVARVAGVIARSARAIDALRLRHEANSEEDEMGGRTYDPDETERIRRELEADCDRLDRLLEEKRAEAAGRSGSAARRAPGQDPEAPD